MAEVQVRRTSTSVLDIEYEESGPADGFPNILLHGFPYDIRQYDIVRDGLVQLGYRVIVPYLRGFGGTRYQTTNITRSGSQASIGTDLIEFLDALRIPQAMLIGFDWGGRAACIVAAIWPERVRGLITCQGYAIQDIAHQASHPADPDMTMRHWYIHYFNTPQGPIGLEHERFRLCKLLWKLWSPNWTFTEEEYARTAKSFENPDFVATVIHGYRHRLGNAVDDRRYEDLESKLAKKPKITVPTIILAGGSDGVDPSTIEYDPRRDQFTGYYERRVLPGVGHCAPVEAPQEVVSAAKTLLTLR